MVDEPQQVVRWPPIHCDEGSRPISRSVPGPRRCTASKPELVQRGLGALDLRPSARPRRPPGRARRGGRCARSAPTAARARRRRRGRDGRAPPTPASDRGRPTSCAAPRSCSRAPARRPGGTVAPDPVGICPVEQARRDRAGEADRRAVVLAVLADHLHDPPRLVSQRLVDARRRGGPAGPTGRGRRRARTPRRPGNSARRPRGRAPPARSSAETCTRCPGWTFAPKSTTRSAMLSRACRRPRRECTPPCDTSQHALCPRSAVPDARRPRGRIGSGGTRRLVGALGPALGRRRRRGGRNRGRGARMDGRRWPPPRAG